MQIKNDTSKVEHNVYSSSSSETTLNTETLAKDLHICEEWNLSIDLKLPNRSVTEWTNVFSIQVIETTDLTGGSLIPAIWVRPDQSHLMLMITYKIGTNQSYSYNTTTKLNAGNWINFKISQVNGVQEIKVDYNLVYNKTNSVPKSWTNINLVTGNIDGKENISTTVHYRNFEINTCKLKSKNMK